MELLLAPLSNLWRSVGSILSFFMINKTLLQFRYRRMQCFEMISLWQRGGVTVVRNWGKVSSLSLFLILKCHTPPLTCHRFWPWLLRNLSGSSSIFSSIDSRSAYLFLSALSLSFYFLFSFWHLLKVPMRFTSRSIFVRFLLVQVQWDTAESTSDDIFVLPNYFKQGVMHFDRKQFSLLFRLILGNHKA